MIAETGHYALILALGVAIVQTLLPLLGRAPARSAACRRCRSGRADAIRLGGDRLHRADHRLCHLGLLGRECVAELPLGQAAALQDLGRVGEPRRLDDLVGADPHAVRRGGRDFRHEPAASAQGQCAGGAGLDRRGLSAVHHHHLESLHPAKPGAVRRAGAEPGVCKTPRSPSIPPSSMPAMSASRWPFRSPSPP